MRHNFTYIIGYVNESIYVAIHVFVKSKLKNSSEDTLVKRMKVYIFMYLYTKKVVEGKT
jgi:hypothetical protein